MQKQHEAATEARKRAARDQAELPEALTPEQVKALREDARSKGKWAREALRRDDEKQT